LIAWFSGGTQAMGGTFTGSFLEGLKDLGYVEGRDFDIVYRYSDGYQDRLPALAEEVVLLRPDVILAAAVITAVAARNKTSTIPIVCPAPADAVHLGLIASDARPGGNVTGIEPYIAGLPAKQIELAREIVPGSSKIGILTDLSDPKAPPQLRELESAGRALGIKIFATGVRRPEEVEDALQTLANQLPELVIVLQTSMLLTERQRIADVALAKRLPTVYGYREHVLAGGLLSYGVDLRWCYYRGATFVDKILHGTAPGDHSGGVSHQNAAGGQRQDSEQARGKLASDAARTRRRSDRVKQRPVHRLLRCMSPLMARGGRSTTSALMSGSEANRTFRRVA
ncbi:MAG: ABC transporter substrate-binding protein, partial [Xanthobacteraceae bacterium]